MAQQLIARIVSSVQAAAPPSSSSSSGVVCSLVRSQIVKYDADCVVEEAALQQVVAACVARLQDAGDVGLWTLQLQDAFRAVYATFGAMGDGRHSEDGRREKGPWETSL